MSRRKHKPKRKTELQWRFEIINRRYFGNRLPKHTKVRWCREYSGTKHLGAFYPCGYEKWRVVYGTQIKRADKPEIRISSDLQNWANLAIATLIHEAVHLWFWSIGRHRIDHGKPFQMKMRELAAKGAMDFLW